VRSSEALPFLGIQSPHRLASRVTLVQRTARDEDFGWGGFTISELRAYFRGRDLFDAPTTILEVQKGSDEEIAGLCCGVDWVLGRWEYLLARAHYHRRPVGLDSAGIPSPRIYRLTPARLRRLETIAKWLTEGKRQTQLRRQAAFRRWHAGVTSSAGIDTVMHGLAALEGLLLQSTGDMRLRLAVRCAGAVRSANRRQVFAQIYRAYKMRNDYAHGIRIPNLTSDQQHELVTAINLVLQAAVQLPAGSLENLDEVVIPWLADTH
jgi:hypothetical protein